MNQTTELLEVYDLKGNLLRVEERKKYYSQIKEEFAKSGKITTKVKSVRLLLSTSEGRIYMQKRSKMKTENAGLYDKTVGGHVTAGDSYDITIVRECAEELGFPVCVVAEDEYNKVIKTTDTSVIGIIRKVDVIHNFLSTRKTGEGDFTQPYDTAIYIGFYDGPLHFKDGESSGIEVMSFDEITEDLAHNPERYTDDLMYMIKKYKTKILEGI